MDSLNAFKVEYILQAFEKKGDALVKEVNVTHVPLSELQRIFGVIDDPNLFDGERAVTSTNVVELQPYLNEILDMENYDWFFGATQTNELTKFKEPL
jgi:hypothetical protein